jgi:hypothetical protein
VATGAGLLVSYAFARGLSPDNHTRSPGSPHQTVHQVLQLQIPAGSSQPARTARPWLGTHFSTIIFFADIEPLLSNW